MRIDPPRTALDLAEIATDASTTAADLAIVQLLYAQNLILADIRAVLCLANNIDPTVTMGSFASPGG